MHTTIEIYRFHSSFSLKSIHSLMLSGNIKSFSSGRNQHINSKKTVSKHSEKSNFSLFAGCQFWPDHVHISQLFACEHKFASTPLSNAECIMSNKHDNITHYTMQAIYRIHHLSYLDYFIRAYYEI